MEWIQKLRNIRGLPWLLLLALLGFFLLLLPGIGNASSRSNADIGADADFYQDIPAYTAYLEHKIAQMTDALSGVSDSVVLVTLDTIPSASGSASRFSMESGSTQTTVPKIRGIAVVCRGGENPDIQLAVISMLTRAFDIPAKNVYIGAAGNG